MTITCFYMAPDDLRTPRTGEPIEVGGTVRVSCSPVLCEQGFHASIHVLHTLEYRAPGRLTLVEIGGETVEGEDKIAGQTRKTLAILDRARTDRVLREIACMSAELGLQWGCFDLGAEPDQRSIDAIDVTRRFACGEVSASDLDAARAAAGDAAGDAAWAAARAAAWAAAGDAAGDAAGAAARDAAGAAIHDVADRMALGALTKRVQR